MYKKLIIDLDGTILEGAEPVNRSREFFKILSELNIDFVVMTNSVKSPVRQISRLSEAGIDIPLTSIINPVAAVNLYIAGKKIARAFIVGSEEEKLQVCAVHDPVNPDIVVFLDFEKPDCSFTDLQEIFILIQRGIPVISASGSPFYVSGDSQRLDTGAFVGLFEAACGSRIEIFGKPSGAYYREVLKILAVGPGEVLVAGDDWRTDARGAIDSGCNAVLVKSGKYRDGDEDNLPGVSSVDSLMEILDYLG